MKIAGTPDSIPPRGKAAAVEAASRQDVGRRVVVPAGWNNTSAQYPRSHLIHQSFEALAEAHPGRVAAVFEDRQLTFAELNERANRLAHYLRRMGVGPEARVGLLIERSLDMVVGLLGILKAGGAYVPLDPSY